VSGVTRVVASLRGRIERSANALPRKKFKKKSVGREFFLASLAFERMYENHDALARAYGPCGYATT